MEDGGMTRKLLQVSETCEGLRESMGARGSNGSRWTHMEVYEARGKIGGSFSRYKEARGSFHRKWSWKRQSVEAESFHFHQQQ